VVLDWNLPDHAIRCVRSIIDDGVPPERVVVVENDPTARTWSRISELNGCVRVRIGENVGFARANNLGASALPGTTYLFLNNDAFVGKAGSVKALLAALEQPDTGLAVPRLLNEDGTLQPSVVPFTTPGVAAVRASGVSRLIPNRWQPRWSTHWDHASSRAIEAATGAVMAVDSAAWEQLGGFRETSFMYAEDIDLCWRLHDLGWTTRFVAESEFVHLGGSSSSLRWSDPERGERIGRSEAHIIRENLPSLSAQRSITIMRLGLTARMLAFHLLRDTQAAETCRGFMRGLEQPSIPLEGPLQEPTVEVVRPEK
jgi:GT2 family glycosyltransferase